MLIVNYCRLEGAQQLPREAFELDPKLRRQLEGEMQKKVSCVCCLLFICILQIDEVRAELAWLSEKHTIALKKLKSKVLCRAHITSCRCIVQFLDNLIVEHITLRSFRTGTSVSCYRTPKLPEFLQQAIKAVHRAISAEEAQRKEGQQAQTQARTQDAKDGDNKAAAAAVAVDKESPGKATRRIKEGKGSPHRPTGVSEADMRKRARTERQKQLSKLLASKPDENIDDPAVRCLLLLGSVVLCHSQRWRVQDVARVAWAKANMGDYKLKSSDSYVVPEQQRVNVERKRRQIVLLQESVHFIKMGLNERFLAMRDLKKRITTNVKKDNARLSELNKKLGKPQELYEPALDPAEWPELRSQFSREDLAAFQRAKEREQRLKMHKGKLFDANMEEEAVTWRCVGFDVVFQLDATDGKEAPAQPAAEATPAPTTAPAPAATAAAPSKEEEEDMTDKFDRGPAAAKARAEREEREKAEKALAASAGKSDMEKAEELIAKKVMEHERQTLIDKIDLAIFSFDHAVAKLRREKFKLDADLKMTDLKVLTLYQELNLLKEFEEEENKVCCLLICDIDSLPFLAAVCQARHSETAKGASPR